MKTLQRIITSITFQRLVNKKAFSALVGRIAERKLPHRFLVKTIRSFAESFHSDLNEFDFSLDSVQTFNEFFARKLKPGARSFGGTLCSPADGFVSYFGPMQAGQLFQVKGKSYLLNELIQGQPSFQEGTSLSIYLSLGDYHRVHLPFDATLLSIKSIPGTLFSLNPTTLEKIEKVYCRNERVVLEGLSTLGRFYLILVGAIVVGKIELNPACTLNTLLKQGAEVGCFKMGSSVLLIYESSIPLITTLDTHLKTGDALC
jgi:phosphatidylserine decarboxylase